MAKYRVTSKMPTNAEGYKAGDIIDYEDKEAAVRLILKGYLEPVGMEQAKQDTQLREYRHKNVRKAT